MDLIKDDDDDDDETSFQKICQCTSKQTPFCLHPSPVGVLYEMEASAKYTKSRDDNLEMLLRPGNALTNKLCKGLFTIRQGDQIWAFGHLVYRDLGPRFSMTFSI